MLVTLTAQGRYHDLLPEERAGRHQQSGAESGNASAYLMPEVLVPDLASERRQTACPEGGELALEVGERGRLLLVEGLASVQLIEDFLHQVGGAKRGRRPVPA